MYVTLIIALFACGDVELSDPAPRDELLTIAEPETDDGLPSPASANDDLKGPPPGMEPATSEHAGGRFTLHDRTGRVLGRVLVEPTTKGIRLHGKLAGLTPESDHGFHIHENSECVGDFTSAGGHFAPEANHHGAPGDDDHHAGDLGNIRADDDGVAMVDITVDDLSLEGERGVSGRALVLHAEADDLLSQPSGDAGQRMGCATFEPATPER